MQTIRVVALLACVALVSFVDAQTTCPACSLSQCAMQGCGVDAPYVCLAGISAGGCNTAPWTNASICTECCDASGCSTMPRFNCSGTCSAEMCHSKKRCADTSPYMCTSGNGTYGCSASPNYWPIMPQCDACCDVKTCENTCTEACTADQCQSNPCTPTSPFLCTGGPLANACSNSPTYFGHDSQCYGCCNSSSCGSSRFSCESKPCPSSVCHSVDRCSLTTKYMCINGSASNGCSASPSYWPSYPQCTDCCDVTSCAFTCPPCTADQCQTNPCTPWDPYVCTAGPLKNGCSGSASYFGQQAQCFSCCDSSSC